MISKSEMKRVAMQNPERMAEEYWKLKKENERLREALSFYAKAKILFASFDGEMPLAKDAAKGLAFSGFETTETHVKDDGAIARAALEDEK